jgi:hypothetical protein
MTYKVLTNNIDRCLLTMTYRIGIIVRTLAEINADKKALAEEEKKALKAHKKEAVATVKKLIVEFNLTKGDLRGKAMKQLEG